MRYHRNKAAFTLVELSIVLVIVGIIIGGVVGGKTILRSAELRSVGNEFNSFKIGVTTFADRYKGFPGDMRNATSFWGDNAAQCADAGVDNGVPGTCNGDGDKQIDAPAAASSAGEAFTFWQHLALAGLIEGNYTGISGTGGAQHSTINVNVPDSRVTGGAWSIVYIGPGFTGDTEAYNTFYGNTIHLGTIVSGSSALAPLLTPEEAWSIDSKFDDSRPAYGNIIARFWDDACATAIDGNSAEDDLEALYNTQDESVQCALYFRDVFGKR